jgi:hypothetical protein
MQITFMHWSLKKVENSTEQLEIHNFILSYI